MSARSGCALKLEVQLHNIPRLCCCDLKPEDAVNLSLRRRAVEQLEETVTVDMISRSKINSVSTACS